MDWADGGTTNYHRCGPVRVDTCCDNHTLAVNWVDDGNFGQSGRFFRAGGSGFGHSAQTAWHANIVPH